MSNYFGRQEPPRHIKFHQQLAARSWLPLSLALGFGFILGRTFPLVGRRVRSCWRQLWAPRALACSPTTTTLREFDTISKEEEIEATGPNESPQDDDDEDQQHADEELCDVPENAPEDCPGVESDRAGHSEACQGCPNREVCASGEARMDSGASKIKEKLSSVKCKLLVLSGKGGVGKSTVATQLAWFLESCGYNVGILDIDVCGPSVPRMTGSADMAVHLSAEGWTPVSITPRLSVMSIGFLLPHPDDAVVWRGPKKNGLIKQFLCDVLWGDLDFLIIDTPPGTSDEHLSIVTYLSEAKIDGALLVTMPQEVSLQDVRKEITFCHKTFINILGVIENFRGSIFDGGAGDVLASCKRMDVKYAGQMPMDKDIFQACERGLPLRRVNPASPALSYLEKLVRESILPACPQVTPLDEMRSLFISDDDDDDDDEDDDDEDGDDYEEAQQSELSGREVTVKKTGARTAAAPEGEQVGPPKTQQAEEPKTQQAGGEPPHTAGQARADEGRQASDSAALEDDKERYTTAPESGTDCEDSNDASEQKDSDHRPRPPLLATATSDSQLGSKNNQDNELCGKSNSSNSHRLNDDDLSSSSSPSSPPSSTRPETAMTMTQPPTLPPVEPSAA